MREFIEIHGDRRFADDGAIVAGLAYFGRARGRDRRASAGPLDHGTNQAQFRQAASGGLSQGGARLRTGGTFGLPLITLIDTQGAESGIGAEERGQTEAIAHNLELMARLTVPIVACVIGEGGSGGALALGVANVVLMQENACYSVITPEGCAAILWRAGGEENVAAAAAALKLSAPDLLELGIDRRNRGRAGRRSAYGAGRSGASDRRGNRAASGAAGQAEAAGVAPRARAQIRRDGIGVPDPRPR